ncbi:MAG: hypothetical protein V2A61_06780 [Calditrichota bacterium]
MPTLTITSDKPIVVIPAEEYDSLRETLEILSDKALMRAIEKGRKEFTEGKTVKLSELRQKRCRNDN